MRLVFDIETNSLLPALKRMWLLIAQDTKFKIKYEYFENDFGWKKLFEKAQVVIGHNILGFDVPALKKLFNYEFPKSVVFHDTALMSRILDYRRFGHRSHSLEVWGEMLGDPKGKFIEYGGWDPEKSIYSSEEEWSEAMHLYCAQDVNVNIQIYEILLAEFSALAKRNPFIKTYMTAEHYAARWQATAQLHGWPFNVEAAKKLFEEIDEKLNATRELLEPRLGIKVIAKDKANRKVETKKPAWTKDGYYAKRTADWFNIPVQCGFEMDREEALEILEMDPQDQSDELIVLAEEILEYGSRPIIGEYCRVEFQPRSLTSPSDVKDFLFEQGWEPSEWNTKRDEETGEIIKTSPKISDDDLELLGGDGALYNEFKSLASRHSIIATWIAEVDENGMLHGESHLVGTPSMRTRHQIIVNVPTAEKPYGKEMRSLFHALPNWKLIGADSSGNQARGLAFYLGDKEFIDVILNKDIHEYNKEKLNDVLEEMGYGRPVTRDQAKRVLYAFLFGASGMKLWSYIFGVAKIKEGNTLKRGFVKAVPGFKDLIDKLENIYGATSKEGYGYIPSLAGNKIYVDSFHKLLVYLLQSLEKITCSTSLMLTMQRLEAENIPYIPLMYYHDEIDFMTPDEYAERASEISEQAFTDGPKLYGIDIMAGQGKIGDTWYEIH